MEIQAGTTVAGGLGAHRAVVLEDAVVLQDRVVRDEAELVAAVGAIQHVVMHMPAITTEELNGIPTGLILRRVGRLPVLIHIMHLLIT